MSETAAERHDRLTRRAELFDRIGKELDRAYAKHGTLPWGRHEFFAILKEEVDELWDNIKRDEPLAAVEDELMQVAAMCFRYYETRDRYWYHMRREAEAAQPATATVR